MNSSSAGSDKPEPEQAQDPRSVAGSERCGPSVDALAETTRLLERRRERIADEISNYPSPVAGCDVQFNHLLDERRKINRALIEIARQGPDTPGSLPDADALEHWLRQFA